VKVHVFKVRRPLTKFEVGIQPVVAFLDLFPRPARFAKRSMRTLYAGDAAFDYIASMPARPIKWGNA
jgi:hypothetical protein